jgi:hypothetical protein
MIKSSSSTPTHKIKINDQVKKSDTSLLHSLDKNGQVEVNFGIDVFGISLDLGFGVINQHLLFYLIQ